MHAKKRLKLCLFNSCPVWGGGEKWHYDVAEDLDREDFEIIAGVQQGSPLQKRLNDSGILTRSFSIGNLSLLNLFLMLSLVRWFKYERPDVVILNLPSDLKTAGVAARIAGVPRIIYRRGSAIPVRNTFLNRGLFGHILTDVIANSEETKKTVLSRNPRLINPARIKVIYNGIDLDSYDVSCKASCDMSEDKPIVLGTAGRLSYQKNQTFLLDVAKLLSERGVNFRLLIAGDGPLKDDLRRRAAELGLDDFVEFCGFVEDISGYMQQLDIFLLSSHWEGFGYVLTEAMACGKPIISFGNSSVPEVVVNGETGLLTAPNDPVAFADAVVSLSEDPERRIRMGTAGRDRVEAVFGKERLLSELAEFLLE